MTEPIGLQVHVDAESVNKMVADAILKSAIGERLNEIVTKHVASLNTGYNNPIDAVVGQHIREVISGILYSEPLYAQIKAAVVAKLEQNELVQRITDEAAGKVVSSMADAVRRELGI